MRLKDKSPSSSRGQSPGEGMGNGRAPCCVHAGGAKCSRSITSLLAEATAEMARRSGGDCVASSRRLQGAAARAMAGGGAGALGASISCTIMSVSIAAGDAPLADITSRRSIAWRPSICAAHHGLQTRPPVMRAQRSGVIDHDLVGGGEAVPECGYKAAKPG